MKHELVKDKRVVISGLGVFTPLARNAVDLCKAVLDGASSIAPSMNINADELLSNLTSEFANDETFGLDVTLTSMTDRGVWFTIKALQEAMMNAKLRRDDLDSERTAVVVGTSHSGIQHTEKIMRAAVTDSLTDITGNDFYAALTDHVATKVCQYLGLKCIKATISSACSSSNTAIGYGRDLLRLGQADRIIVIGTDTLSESILAGFNSLKALNKFPAAPFSSPSGISLGEGAGVLILESLDELERSPRDIPHRGEILGYALSSDAFHATSVDETGEGIQAAITHALTNADVSWKDIDYISAHGTGTDSNDVPESLAVERLFGNNVKISSVKSYVGHTLGASGVIELIISLVCAEKGYLPPSKNFTEVRAGCAQLDYVIGPQMLTKINTILCNNYGFGGNNSSLVVVRNASQVKTQHTEHSRVFVSAYSNYTSASKSGSDWTARLPEHITFSKNSDEFNTYIGKVATPTGEKSSARRSSPSIQFAVKAMEDAVANFELQGLMSKQCYETGLVAGLMHGAQKAVEKFMFSIYQDGLAYASSIQFPLTTLNAAAGEVSIKFGIKGFNSTFCGPVGSMKFAFDMVRMGRQERMFNLSADELTPLVIDMCNRLGVLGRYSDEGQSAGFYLNDGASVTLLESEIAIMQRGGKKLAEVVSMCVGQDGNGHQLDGVGEGLAKVAKRALQEADVSASDIDLVIAVGQGTNEFMRNEANALNAIFAANQPTLTSVAMHLGYSPTAMLPQMVNLGAAILSGASFAEADRQSCVWTPKPVQAHAAINHVIVLFTSVTFEHCAIVLRNVNAGRQGAH